MINATQEVVTDGVRVMHQLFVWRDEGIRGSWWN